MIYPCNQSKIENRKSEEPPHLSVGSPLKSKIENLKSIDGAQFINYNYQTRNNKIVTPNSFSQITVKLF